MASPSSRFPTLTALLRQSPVDRAVVATGACLGWGVFWLVAGGWHVFEVSAQLVSGLSPLGVAELAGGVFEMWLARIWLSQLARGHRAVRLGLATLLNGIYFVCRGLLTLHSTGVDPYALTLIVLSLVPWIVWASVVPEPPYRRATRPTTVAPWPLRFRSERGRSRAG